MKPLFDGNHAYHIDKISDKTFAVRTDKGLYIIEVDIIHNKVEQLKVILKGEYINWFSQVGDGTIICGTGNSYFMIENDKEPRIICETKHGIFQAICVLGKLGDKYKDLAITCEDNSTFILNMKEGVLTQIMITGFFDDIFLMNSDDDSFTIIAKSAHGILEKYTVRKELLDLCLL